MCYHFGINIQRYNRFMTQVTCRGKVGDDGIIDFPDDWNGKIDVNTINVQLTPLKVFQELFVDSIQYGRRALVRNSSGGVIDAMFEVNAELT